MPKLSGQNGLLSTTNVSSNEENVNIKKKQANGWNVEVLEYKKKIKTFSNSTIKLLIYTGNTEKEIEQKHKIVMESKTEEEVVEKLKEMKKYKF